MTTRRGFFKLLAGAAALAAVPAPSLGRALPILWGDGIHDDAPALNALLRGEAVEFADAGMAEGIGWTGDVLRLAGRFRVSAPVIFGREVSCGRIDATASTIIAGKDFVGFSVLGFEGSQDSSIDMGAIYIEEGAEVNIWLYADGGGKGRIRIQKLDAGARPRRREGDMIVARRGFFDPRMAS